jgi:hypothetical protein
MSAWVVEIDGFEITCTRSAGEPTWTHASRMRLTTAAVVRWVRGCPAITIALRPLSANRALTGGVASGPVAGIRPATTPTGLAILTSPRDGSRSTTPTVGTPRRSPSTPITRRLILVSLSGSLPKPPSSAAIRASVAAASLRTTAQATAVTSASTCSWE